MSALQLRVVNLEAVLSRPELSESERANVNVELEAARRSLAGVVKVLLAAHTQNQQQQQQQQQSLQGGGGGSNAELLRAQTMAMQKRNADLVAAGGLLNSVQYRTASPQQQQQLLQSYGGGGQALTLPPTLGGNRVSPAMTHSTLPGSIAGSPPIDSTTSTGGTTAATTTTTGGGGPAKKVKKLTKKQQAALAAAEATALLQNQSTAVGVGQQQSLTNQAHAQAQALHSQAALAQALALQQQQQANAAAGGSVSGSTSGQQQQQQIATMLTMMPAHPEAFSAPRPTLSLGLANSPVVSTPAITRHPGLTAAGMMKPGGPSSLGGAAGGAGGAAGAGGGGGKDLRADSKGRTVSKRKIRELVESVDREERLSDEVEDVRFLSLTASSLSVAGDADEVVDIGTNEQLLLEIADEFIDSITRFACQLAKHRKSERLEVKDLALHLGTLSLSLSRSSTTRCGWRKLIK